MVWGSGQIVAWGGWRSVCKWHGARSRGAGERDWGGTVRFGAVAGASTVDA